MFGPFRIVLQQPFAKQKLYFVRQPEEDVACATRPRFAGGTENGLQFMVRNGGNHRRDHDPDRHAGLRQRLDHAQTGLRRGGARLESAFDFIGQRRDAQHDGNQPVACQVRQQIQIPQDQRALRDERHRVPAAGQHFENAASDAETPFQGLVAIGVDAESNRLAHVSWFGKLRLEQFDGVGLVEKLGFEIQSRREAEIRVGGTCEAIDTGVAAAAIRIDGDIEPDIR